MVIAIGLHKLVGLPGQPYYLVRVRLYPLSPVPEELVAVQVYVIHLADLYVEPYLLLYVALEGERLYGAA